LISNGHIQLSKIPYEFEYLPCGIKNSRVIRWVLDSASRCDQTVVPDLSDKRLVLDFLTKINTRITNGVILPPILAGIINIRKDVGSYFSYFNGSTGDLNGLINWSLTAGCTEEDLQTFSDALNDENIRLDTIKTSDVQTVVEAWECRQDLQESLGLFWKSSESMQRLKGWLEGSGLSELGISMDRFTSISNAFKHGAEKILHAYFIRSDLQEVFPRIYDCQTLESLSNWMHSNLRQIPNATHDDIDAFRFVYGKHVEILPLVVLNSQWIRHFIPEPRQDINKAILDAIGVEQSRYEDALKLIRPMNKHVSSHAKHGQAVSPLTINVAGNFSASTGIGQSVRTLCKSLENLDRPVAQAMWTLPSLYSCQASFDCSSLLGNSIHEQADVSIAGCNADSTLYLRKQVPPRFWNASRKVGYWVWETERLPESMLEGHDLYDEIWTPSEYSASAIRAVINKPVYVVPHSLPTEDFIIANSDKIRDRIESWKPGKSLKIGYFYDSKSTVQRKNPDAFLDLVEELQSEGIAVEPIIKVSSPSFGDYRYEAFISRAHQAGAKMIYDDLLDADIFNLYLELDFYVSLHRAEGFGLTCAEALSLGVMTIATAYSGNLDFMDSQNAVLVGGDPYYLSSDVGPYPYGTKWINPSVQLAKAEILRFCHDNGHAKLLMSNALRTSQKKLSAQSVGQVISQLLR
jgi:glycosyltransferase involved in cell wall biosynthesis